MLVLLSQTWETGLMYRTLCSGDRLESHVARDRWQSEITAHRHDPKAALVKDASTPSSSVSVRSQKPWKQRYHDHLKNRWRQSKVKSVKCLRVFEQRFWTLFRQIYMELLVAKARLPTDANTQTHAQTPFALRDSLLISRDKLWIMYPAPLPDGVCGRTAEAGFWVS